MNRFSLVLFSLILTSLTVAGCGDDPAGTVVNVTSESFECILDGTPVRRFFVRNLLGNDADSVAVANGEAPLPYPPGTVIQLFPQEAMVKREAGFSTVTNDWEFFFLNITSEGTEIATRGREETVNMFGGNCFDCHQDARDNDFICETDNGCVELPVGEEVIRSLQDGDPRCP